MSATLGTTSVSRWSLMCAASNCVAQAEMAEVLRAIVPRVELRPLRERPDPVVLRGITLAPKHGVRVVVERVLQPPGSPSEGRGRKAAEVAA